MKKRNPVIDELRQQYIDLLPEIKLVAQELKTRIKSALLPLVKQLKSPAGLEVKVRIKDCESAIKKLRKKKEGVFDPENDYSLLELDDLVGARVLTFMNSTLVKANKLIKGEFKKWKADHKAVKKGAKKSQKRKKEKPLWLKYKGKCNARDRIKAEVQLCPMLIGYFGDVEHSAIYKPAPELKNIDTIDAVLKAKDGVYTALQYFEKIVEDEYRKAPKTSAGK